jgi:hypothetical protein
MWTRRQLLKRGGLGLLGAAGLGLAVPGDGKGREAPLPPDIRRGGADEEDHVPDGSAAKDMITPRTDQAINRGLEFLNRQRHANGSFGTGAYAGNVAVTSLAALAFMAGGHQPNRGLYGRVVLDALRFVLSQEKRDGLHDGYLHNPNATPHGPMYGHGFGTLFLGEVSGMVHDRALRQEVQVKLHKAVKLILDSQTREGGWRYTPGSPDADISVTICQIMALRSARNAGVAVPKSKVDRCIEYVKRCQDRQQGWFRYMLNGGGGGGQQGFARTAAGVAALYSAGIYKGEEVEAGLRFLMQNKPGGRQEFFQRPDIHYFYGHYYAAQVMWTAGGQYWKEWFPAIREELLATQRQPEGCWLDAICTHYGTAMACIILQVPNNYLPILQK